MVHQTRDRDMSPEALGTDGTTTTLSRDYSHSYEPRTSTASRGYSGERGSLEQAHALNGGGNGSVKEGFGGSNGSVLSVPYGVNGYERTASAKSLVSIKSRRSATNLAAAGESERRSGEPVTENFSRPRVIEESYLTAANGNVNGNVNGSVHGKPAAPPRSSSGRPVALTNGDVTAARSVSNGHAQPPMTPSSALPPVVESSPHSTLPDGMLKPPGRGPPNHHRASSPPAFNPSASSSPAPSRPDRLTHRHTLEVPKLVPVRTSKDGSEPTTSMDGAVVSASGRFSPSTPNRRRASLQLHRRQTRSVHSELHLDDVPQDEDAARWAEHIKQKRARKQRQDTDDERVVVGTKVDDTHVNYVTAYNMLTGIRFVVSRNNAKLDRDLTEADFVMKQKFSFDITGNELTPSTKYDFKFKDYAPWVFRHLRSNFKIDPAEYLMSLTSKYILSELGSPGKSGSFFYFSRDYKYIIKTIHHAEHKFLRKILKDYYMHVTENPNTLLSQFYGLHRVKLPFGRKIHFVVMNNLFPPHRDIHRTFDLKGSTIGRDFKEEDLEKNPRATLKDLNWLRRNLHLEFGPTKKEAFVLQMQKDVALLQKLKIMDYSLLVGIHDLERGNEENLRDKTLQVFQPGGDKQEEGSSGPHNLLRTPSKMENAKRARELREAVKKQRPVPMDQTLNKMPDEAHRSSFYFYADDGGFRATHEDDAPGEEIYYLGIIDCLTRYNYIKKAEHFWKGLGGHESQISPIPPVRYGDRFVKFISGITMSREAAEKERASAASDVNAVTLPSGREAIFNDPNLGGVNVIHEKASNPAGTEAVMEEASHIALKTMQNGASEEDVPDRQITTVRSPGGTETDVSQLLPVIGEAGENASNASRTPSRITPSHSHEDMTDRQRLVLLGNANMPSEAVGEVPPPTPPKMDGSIYTRAALERLSWGGKPPPTPPKDGSRCSDERRSRGPSLDKALPLPPATYQLSASPTRIGDSTDDGWGGLSASAR